MITELPELSFTFILNWTKFPCKTFYDHNLNLVKIWLKYFRRDKFPLKQK